MGYELLKDDPLFANAAELIRYHHTSWANGRGAECNSGIIPLGSHILNLADAVGRTIVRSIPVLKQAELISEKMVSLSGKQFQPDCVEAFRSVAHPEAFWLDTVSERIYSVLLRQMD